MTAVASRNPFDILNDETPGIPQATPKATEKVQADAPATRGGQKGRSVPSKGGRYYQRGGAASTWSSREPATETTDDAPREGKRASDERGRGRGRGGRGRGERGRGHGRPFDRHSATGKTDTEKKINQGWGADEGNKELKAEQEGFKDATEEEAPVDDPWGPGAAAHATIADDGWGVAPVDPPEENSKDAAPAEGRRNREEEEDNTLTLDQYLAQQKETSLVPKLENVRKANDGADDLFKDAIQVVKDVEEDAYIPPKVKTAKARPKKVQKQVIGIDAQFSDRPRGGRGAPRGAPRGGRGFDRGGKRFGDERGRGRGRGRGGDATANEVSLTDEVAFPSLS